MIDTLDTLTALKKANQCKAIKNPMRANITNDFKDTFNLPLVNRFTKGRLKVSLKSLVIFALIGFLIALHWLAFFKAVKVSNVSITLAMMSTC